MKKWSRVQSNSLDDWWCWSLTWTIKMYETKWVARCAELMMVDGGDKCCLSVGWSWFYFVYFFFVINIFRFLWRESEIMIIIIIVIIPILVTLTFSYVSQQFFLLLANMWCVYTCFIFIFVIIKKMRFDLMEKMFYFCTQDAIIMVKTSALQK